MTTLETQLRSLLEEHPPTALHRAIDMISQNTITVSPTRGTLIYPPDRVPPGLLTFADAERRFGLKTGRVKAWVFRGHLQERGRVRASARGGGRVLVAEDDVAHLVTHPPRRTGRPPKSKENRRS